MSVVTVSCLLFYLACSSPSIKMHTSVFFWQCQQLLLVS